MANVRKKPLIKLTTRHVKLFVLISGCLAFAYFFKVAPEPISAGALVPEFDVTEPLQTDKDYSKFQHGNAFHSRLPCLVCHTRNDNSTRIGFPGRSGHLPCAGCHGLQFSDNSSPICTICHTNAETGSLKRFPGLRTFGARFVHDRHARVNCSVCHGSSRRGVAFSIPSGPTAHATCFRCHTASSSNTMASCSTCHQPGRLVRTPEWTRAFTVSFSHRRHLTGTNMNCTSCHSVLQGAARGRQVTAPLASMHFAPPVRASCGKCHNSERAFGTSDFANCKRCHLGNSFKF
jgi:c(7)-type cytochrome triheme protein